MKGADRVIRLRLEGYKPSSCWLYFGSKKPDSAPRTLRPYLEELNDEHPDIWTDGDIPETADLRWVRGLVIHMIADRNTPDDLFDRWVNAVAQNEPAAMGMLLPNGEVAGWKA